MENDLIKAINHLVECNKELITLLKIRNSVEKDIIESLEDKLVNYNYPEPNIESIHETERRDTRKELEIISRLSDQGIKEFIEKRL